MPLPKIQTPKYTLTVPSTGKDIQYRPFLVKEEKLLLVSQETDDPNQIIDAMKQIVENCTFGDINVNKLATYDLEYIFLNLRSKSVGETSTINIKCKECGELHEYVINLSNIKVTDGVTSADIKINDEVGITLKSIKVKDIKTITNADSTSNLNVAIRGVIDSIYDSNAVYDVADVPVEELDEFIDSLTHSALEDINEFISKQPVLKEDIKFKCNACGADNEFELRGFQSFFK